MKPILEANLLFLWDTIQMGCERQKSSNFNLHAYISESFWIASARNSLNCTKVSSFNWIDETLLLWSELSLPSREVQNDEISMNSGPWDEFGELWESMLRTDQRSDRKRSCVGSPSMLFLSLAANYFLFPPVTNLVITGTPPAALEHGSTGSYSQIMLFHQNVVLYRDFVMHSTL